MEREKERERKRERAGDKEIVCERESYIRDSTHKPEGGFFEPGCRNETRGESAAGVTSGSMSLIGNIRC